MMFTWNDFLGAFKRPSGVASQPVVSEVDANVAATLMVIRKCEGTAGPDGYRTLFGGSLFSSYEDHPRRTFEFTNTQGVVQRTSAAGAYQFIIKTWDNLAHQLFLPDFSPASQDKAALELIRQCGALDDAKGGFVDDVARKCGRVWASLPSSTYPQHTRSWEFVHTAFAEAGGKQA